jgi:carbohydrate-selective porin OprB
MSSISFDSSLTVSNTHLSILIAALGIVTIADRVSADEQTAAHKTDTSVIAEAISSNPGAVDVRTGTGELAETIEGVVGLPRDTGVFLGGVWVADANCLLTGGADPGKWSFNRLLIVGAGLDAEKLVGWPGEQHHLPNSPREVTLFPLFCIHLLRTNHLHA